MTQQSPAVLILTAGRGTRLGEYTTHLNKALLPLGKRAAISRIIDCFSRDSRFVIAVGHRAEQVETYLRMAHPEIDFTFVMVDNFDQPGSGPGCSALSCADYLNEPFFYVSCDTLWDKHCSLPTDYNWVGSAHVTEGERAAYCNLQVDPDSNVIAIRDKEEVVGEDYQAFIGLAFIKDHAQFWNSLRGGGSVQGEHQFSAGLESLIPCQSVKALTLPWVDLGTISKYEQAVATYEHYDFSKADEALYISENRVIKFFANPAFAETRVARARANPAVFPHVSDAQHGFYSYPFVQGATLYEYCTNSLFERLLSWLPNNLWKPVKVDPSVFAAACDSFYRKKTMQRLKAYFEKYPLGAEIRSVNGVALQPVAEVLDAIPWGRICQGNASFFHGDFHFDHILFDDAQQSFTLLDWRQDFGGHSEFGDTYYDLAKFCGGLRLNYDYIKEGRFLYQESGNDVELSFDRRPEGDIYEARFHMFIQERGYQLETVKALVPIIFLNMAPLHHYPFDKLLFALGCLTLQQELLRLESIPLGAFSSVTGSNSRNGVSR